jgi:hypothetical protein
LPEYPLIFDRLAFASYDNPNQLGFKTDIDEVRVGSTLAEVMVVDSEPEFWFGYAIAEGDWVETGAWLSRVNVRNAPWIWSEDLGKYLYINSEAGWVFFPK